MKEVGRGRRDLKKKKKATERTAVPGSGGYELMSQVNGGAFGSHPPYPTKTHGLCRVKEPGGVGLCSGSVSYLLGDLGPSTHSRGTNGIMYTNVLRKTVNPVTEAGLSHVIG